MDKKPSLSLVVAVYNEEELLEDFVRKSYRDLSLVSDDFEIILVDDGSTDSSRKIENELSKKIPEVKVIKLNKNYGLGTAYKTGFAAATKDFVFNNTVDAFFNTEDLPKIIPYLRDNRVVSCYRIDKKSNNIYQKALTVGNYWLIRLLFPVKLAAYQTLQFFPIDFYKKVKIEANSTFISPEQLIKAAALGYEIKEIPIHYHPRKKGKAKGGKLRFVWQTFKNILKFWLRWVVLCKPVAEINSKKYFIKPFYSETLRRGMENFAAEKD